MKQLWQWRNQDFESDLFETEDQALLWAERALAGDHGADVAVRRLDAHDWRTVAPGGYVDTPPPPKPDLAVVLLAWADQMEKESSTSLGLLLATELRNRIHAIEGMETL